MAQDINLDITPEIDSINEPYWTGLREGKLLFQACTCGHAWLPPRALCPRCLTTDWSWQKAAGRGAIESWVVYHVAYHPAFKDKLPYNVAIVKLEEGPKLITNVVEANDKLYIDAPVYLHVDMALSAPLAQFKLAG